MGLINSVPKCDPIQIEENHTIDDNEISVNESDYIIIINRLNLLNETNNINEIYDKQAYENE